MPRTVTVSAAQDGDAADETATITHTVSGYGTVTTADEVAVTVEDDAPGSLTVTFDAAAYSATEGGADATVTVLLSSPAPGQVDIRLTAVGQGGAISTDWSGVPEILAFNAGDTSRSFTVIAVDDEVDDDGEMVELGFEALPSGFAPGIPATAVVTLMNDDITPLEPVRNQCPADSGERMILVGSDNILQAGESHFWRVELDPWRFYVIEVLGSDGSPDILGETNPGDLTLSDPHLYATWNGDGSELIRRTGSQRRTRTVIERGSDFSGFHQFEVRSFGGNSGTYRIKIRVNNICVMRDGKAVYSYDGGPDGYTSDRPADPSTGNTFRLRPRPSENISQSFIGFLGDNWDWYWDQVPDEDWFAVEGVSEDSEYTINVETIDELSVKHQATRLKILALYDSNGVEVPGTSGTGIGKRVSVTFQPDNTGLFYVSVGSDPSDRTGVYQITISARNLQEDSNQRRGSEPSEEPGKPGKNNPEGNDQSKKDSKSDDGNSSARGVPVITGTAQVGEALTADTSGISDPDGLQNATFTYQWTAGGTDIQGATGSSYTIVEDDEGLTIKVTVSFTDDAENSETLTSVATAAVQTVTNNPATGQPSITGTAQVGETLTAVTSGISDPDGLQNATFTYQWLADDVAIQGATGSSYTLTEDDEELTIRVSVSFTDDAGNSETLTSVASLNGGHCRRGRHGQRHLRLPMVGRRHQHQWCHRQHLHPSQR